MNQISEKPIYNDDENDQNGHNLANIQAMTCRFCIGVDLDNTNG